MKHLTHYTILVIATLVWMRVAIALDLSFVTGFAGSLVVGYLFPSVSQLYKDL